MAKTDCPKLVATGICDNSHCTHRHKVSSCNLCSLVFTSPAEYAAHARGAKHLKKARGETGGALYCPICEQYMYGTKSWAMHTKSKRHRARAQQNGQSLDILPEEPRDVPGRTLCTTCNVQIPYRQWPSHHLQSKHKRQAQFLVFRTALDEAERDKNGVSVQDNLDFGIVDAASAEAGVVIQSTIRNNTPSSKIALVSMTLASDKGSRTVTPFSVSFHGNRPIPYNAPYTFTATLRQNFNGRAENRLEIFFEDTQLSKRFVIARILRAHVGDRADHQVLEPRAPYKPRKRTARQPEAEVVPGVPPESLKAVPYVTRLPQAPIPQGLLSTLATGNTAAIVANVRLLFLPPVLDSGGYARHFKHLLWIEEVQMENDLEHYDLFDAKLDQRHSTHFLAVPGLAEKRPSVLVGDRILVQQSGASTDRWFEGGVHVVQREDVGLRFHRSFNASAAARFTVRFKLNRCPLRRQHQALDTAFSEDRVLFPVPMHVPDVVHPNPTSAQISIFNPLIASNAPQLQAVVSIVKRQPGSVPFIIFGPPGTGKTVTMVEAIRQVLVADPQARVLACAPSNSAADLIASRLASGPHPLSTGELFRFYAPSRNTDHVSLELREYTHTAPGGHFAVPPLARTQLFRVIVTTCVSASVVSGIGIPRGHYSHIFIDEAGQATEPEAMIAIQTMADTKTNIILSGDPKQLGPIIRSAVAQELGLQTSYIERLMQREIYDEGNGYGKSVVKLTKNFRSHNAILQFPNERFYKGELTQCGDPEVINAYVDSPLLPEKTFPIIFHAISGKDDREASSPSFFNIDEITQVKKYIGLLRDDRRVQLTDGDIGVIAPYRAQCRKIRIALREDAESVKVGSVEEFQGQERKVIIMSTVRSSRDFVQYDLRHTLGFVANPRRFNVAVTRAKALLIVVGDPNVLGLDPLWRSFLNYVYNAGGWVGGDISWDPQAPVDEAGGYDQQMRDAAQLDMNAFTEKITELAMAGVAGEGGDGDDMDVDHPWQEVE